MIREELTNQEARDICDAIHPTLGYLTRLAERLEHLRFGPNDDYYRLLAAAREALHALSVATHYQGCASGVGRPPKA